MGNVAFSGKVFPLFMDLSMGIKAVKVVPIVPLDFRPATLTLAIEKAEVTVSCEIEGLKRSEIDHLYKEAFVMAQAHVDIVAFNTAVGFQLVLNTMIFDGETTELYPNNSALLGVCTAYGLGNAVPVLQFLMQDANLSISFHDLIGAISAPDYAPVSCGRATDGLRQIISDYDPDVKKGWQALRTALNADQAYVQLITANSTRARHGHHVYQDEQLTNQILLRSWTLMNRYLVYALRGKMPLAPPEFETLVG